MIALALALIVGGVVALGWLIAADLRYRPDPVDAAYLTAVAALSPDSLPECDCEDCAWLDQQFAAIAAANPDLYLIPPTEESR